jgi:hypothetical protein
LKRSLARFAVASRQERRHPGNDVIDAQTLVKVKMPDRDGFIPRDISEYKPNVPRPFTIMPEPAPGNEAAPSRSGSSDF